MKQIENLIETTAVAFHLAYRTLIKKHHEMCVCSGEDFSVYIFPAISVSAFSCEVALKNHIFAECGKMMKVHKLDKLFKKMSVDKQNIYRNTTIKLYNMSAVFFNSSDTLDEKGFEILLKENSNAFVKWRYMYESPSKANLDFLEALMFALNDCEDDYFDFIKQTRKVS